MNNISEYSNKDLIERNDQLILISNILKKINIKFYIQTGTFLGAVRDKNFIKWDWDVELAVMIEHVNHKMTEIISELKNNNFKILFIDNTYQNFKIVSSKSEHTKFAIQAYFREGTYRSRLLWQYPAKYFESNNKIDFLGYTYDCPSLEYLEWSYGDWKKPIKSNSLSKKNTYLNSSIFRKRKKLEKLERYILIKKSKFKKILFKILNRLNSRESLFRLMLKDGIKDKDNFIDVGTDDCKESIIISHVSRCNIHIFEPDRRNITTIKKSLKKIRKKNNVHFNEILMSDTKGKSDFFINNEQSNLNSLNKNNNHNIKKILVNSTTLDSYVSEHNLDNMLIKADIEGGEVKLLLGGMKTLLSKNRISLLLELHPDLYKDSKIRDIFKELFNFGYKVVYVESAGIPQPKIFKKYNLKPFKILNNRGLYKNISNQFVLKYAFQESNELIDDFTFFSKSIRSILISNIIK